MPFRIVPILNKIKKEKEGFKVCKAVPPFQCFSKSPIPLENAKKQLKAIEISESKGKSKKKNLRKK